MGIQILLDERSNIMCRYTLIDWEFIFAEPLSVQQFNDITGCYIDLEYNIIIPDYKLKIKSYE